MPRTTGKPGVRHIVALRGDPAGGPNTVYEPHPGGYINAADLVAGLKRIAPFEVSVAGYPEKHPDSPTAAADMDNLKAKVDAGADRIITQFGFDNAHYLRFLERARAAGIWVPITPGIVPIHNFKQVAAFAARAGASMPSWLARRFDGLENDPATSHLVAAAVATEQVMDLVDEGREEVPLLHPQPRRPRLRHLPLAGAASTRCSGSQHARQSARGGLRSNAMQRKPTFAALQAAADKRILIIDGAMGTMIQRYKLDEDGYRGARFKDWHRDVKGNNDLLVLTQPQIIGKIHEEYLEAGADIIETNTFNAQRISLADYGMEDLAYEMNVAAAKIARAAADKWNKMTPDKVRFVAGAVGPTNRTASISPRVSDPGFRNVRLRRAARGLQGAGSRPHRRRLRHHPHRDDLRHAQRQGGGSRHAGSVRRKGHRVAGDDLRHHHRPVGPHAFGTDAGSVLVLDASPEAVLHRAQLRAGRRADAALSRRAWQRIADARISAYPNAGLPNAMGEYDESPHDMACDMAPWAKDGIVNIVGGCCGSTPDHIREVAEHVKAHPPRKIPHIAPKMRLSGLEPFVHG